MNGAGFSSMTVKKTNLLLFICLMLNLRVTTTESDEEHDEMVRLQERLNHLTAEYHDLKNLVVSLEPACDCEELCHMQDVRKDGAYYVYIDHRFIRVFCEFNSSKFGNLTDNGIGYNWLVLLRRTNGKENFYRNWANYTLGFGDVNREFWLGLKNIYTFLQTNNYLLRVELEDFDGNTSFAEYKTFTLRDDSENYRLNVSGYNGTAGDALSYHHEHQFSTYDMDKDQWNGGSCAQARSGGWWYNSCSYVNLNGLYFQNGSFDPRGLHWFTWKKNYYSVKRAEMKMRRI